ncbi:hypothetical protein AN619_15870 [Thermotalea metallivorans]|uniref:Uncharacterized protein n=1 Tax=Thermotalea metallivorans TaxID=520762 RepID=A0A140L4W6_9FIRM|nr:hypothetical protein AN619_15870 [Thermotalea metallivorans]
MLLERGENKVNQNIEVINKHLWAVKFSFLPFISEINYVPDDTVPVDEEVGQLLDTGIILLNKEHKLFEVYKDGFCRIMNKSNRQIKNELSNAKRIPNKDKWQILYMEMLKLEQKRRKIERGEL